MDDYRDRGPEDEGGRYDRGAGRGPYRRGYDREDYEGYGRAAMGGRDYSRSGEDPPGGGYAARGPYDRAYENRDYARGDFDAGYGRGQASGSYYSRRRRMEPDYEPDDDYRRGAYGSEWDPDYGRGRGSLGRDREWDDERGYGRDRGYGADYRRAYQGSSYDRELQGYGEGYEPGYGRPAGRGGSPGRTRITYAAFWLVPGPHVGRGPQGYERSKDRIKEEVSERLAQHGQIDASNIRVRVENDEVTLEGTVDSRETKRMAEDVAESVSGVRDVHNRLRVKRDDQDGEEQTSASNQQRSRSNQSEKEGSSS